MSEPSVLPVQRHYPAPGIIVDRSEKSVTITGSMEMFGPEATSARAESVQKWINTTWTGSFPDGYTSRCTITVRHRGPGTPAGAVAQIEADKISGPSNVSTGSTRFGSRRMQLNANESDAFAWTAAHEFGHMIGLDDRYSESAESRKSGAKGGPRTNTIQPGYEGNLMGAHDGTIASKNLKDLATENEPSRYWINDDDQVRDWVNSHPLAEVTALSTTSKLQAIRTLMGGWISDSDVEAIKRICQSVTAKEEAVAIRNGINLSDFNSNGQKNAVRVAFAKMP